MVQCPACAALAAQARLDALSGLFPSERAVSLDAIAPNGPDTARILAMARRYCHRPWGLWTLWGGFGNAKTLVLQAIVNHFRRGGQLAIYVRFHDLLDHIRAGHAPDADHSARQRYQRLLRVRVLAIDELDKARITPYAHEFRTLLLDDRYRYALEPDSAVQRHTLLALNSNPAHLPPHIYDRLRDGRFGCTIDGIWHPGITCNRDPSMRPALSLVEGPALEPTPTAPA
jgi:hypothetical protein